MSLKIEDEWVERLATVLAQDAVDDHIYGDHWDGWPDPDNEEQMQESFELNLPRAREVARSHLEIALNTKGD